MDILYINEIFRNQELQNLNAVLVLKWEVYNYGQIMNMKVKQNMAKELKDNDK